MKTSMKELTQKQMASMGGVARAKLPKDILSEIGKKGGRPRGKLDKSAIHKRNKKTLEKPASK